MKLLSFSISTRVRKSDEARMKTSPISQKYSTVDYYGYEFDYQTDFTQFLEEPRKNGFHGNLNAAPLEQAERIKLDGEKRNRKSWKSSLFSWLKTENTNKTTTQQSNGTTISKPGQGHFSGSVNGTGGGITGGLWPQRPTSRPHISLFNLTRRVKGEVPYMSLGQLNNPQDVQSYGPVYMVS